MSALHRLALGLSLGTVAFGCQPAAEPQGGEPGADIPGTAGDIVLGVAGPFTGESAQFGFQIEKGVAIALAEINGAGGINGRQVRIVQVDDEGLPNVAGTVARQLAQNPEVLAVVGHFNSRCSLTGIEIYKEAGLVMLSPASTNSTLCRANRPWAFRNIFNDEFQGQTLANYIHGVLGLQTAAVIYENDDYGRGLKDHFLARARELGLQVVAEQAYDSTTADFTPLVRTAINANPQIIVMSGLYTQAARIAQATRELGSSLPLIGGDGVFSEEYMNLAGAAAEGTLVTTPFLFELAGDRAASFMAEYERRYPGVQPDAWAALAYDAVKILCEAIERRGAGRTAIREHLESVNSPETAYQGLTGNTYFNADGDCLRPIQVAQVQGGHFGPAPRQFEGVGPATAGQASE